MNLPYETEWEDHDHMFDIKLRFTEDTIVEDIIQEEERFTSHSPLVKFKDKLTGEETSWIHPPEDTINFYGTGEE